MRLSALFSAGALAGAAILAQADANPAAAAQKTGPAPVTRPLGYTAPASADALKAWRKAGELWRVQRPGDPNSPRWFLAETGPRFGVRSLDGAVQDITKDTGLRFAAKPALEPLEVWGKVDGRSSWITLAPTRLGGSPGVFFMEIWRPRGSADYLAVGVEMPEPVFRAWGGVARMMVLRRVIPNMESVPAQRRAQIARAPLRQQVAFFEAGQNKLYNALAPGLLMSQAATLMRMRELNYDLLFGNDYTDPTIGGGRQR